MNFKRTVAPLISAGLLVFLSGSVPAFAADSLTSSTTASREWTWTAGHTAIVGFLALLVAALIFRVARLQSSLRSQSEQLRQSHDRFQALVERSLVGVYVIQNGRFVYVNPCLAEIFGYSTQELLKMESISEVIHPDDRDLVSGQIQQRITGELTTAHYTFRCTRKDGSVIDVEVLGSRSEFGGAPSVVGTLLDVTKRKRAEEQLAEAGNLLDTMLNSSPDCIYFKDRDSRFVHASQSLARLFHADSAEQLKGKTDFDFFLEEHARAAFEDEQRIIRTGEAIIGKPERETYPDGRTTWALTTKLPWFDKNGNIIGTIGISKDVTAIKEAERLLQHERELFTTLVENLPDAIYFKDTQSRFVRLSRSKVERARQLLLQQYRAEHPDSTDIPEHLQDVHRCSEYLVGKTDFDIYPEDRARKAFEQEQEIIRTGKPIIGQIEKMPRIEDGTAAWYHTTKMLWRDQAGNVIGTFGVTRDITELKEAEAKLESVHQRLVETSRLAGMAEVATDVLHNVGNVLNSVNVSCSLAIDRIRESRMGGLSRVSTLMEQNQERLGEFFINDPRGRQLPGYLSALANQLNDDQALLVKELEQILRHIDHIKQIVAMQQSYAKVAGVREQVSVPQLVEDALSINAAALKRHEIRVECQFETVPDIVTEKHKVLQILVNLIRNAKYAMDEVQRQDKQLQLRVGTCEDGSVKVEVIDNGIGIPPENLTRIFAHGFTTRRNGHGFGLHSSAIAIRELGGSLTAESGGIGQGATFRLVLPCQTPEPRQFDTQLQPQLTV